MRVSTLTGHVVNCVDDFSPLRRGEEMRLKSHCCLPRRGKARGEMNTIITINPQPSGIRTPCEIPSLRGERRHYCLYPRAWTPRGVAAEIGQSDATGGVQENDARRRHEATGDVLFFP